MVVKSYAKINLGIEILGKRPDGYHELRTLFQSVGLYDVLDFTPVEGSAIRLFGDRDEIVWDRTNLIHRAARLLQKESGKQRGVHIRVNKRIPPGRGLGGGSSNAAVTLHVLNRLWNIGLPQNRLFELGAGLGADVPYFLEGGLCLGQGRGESLSSLPDLKPFVCVLVWPNFPISTTRIYEAVILTSPPKESNISGFLAGGDFSLLGNDLEKTVFRLYPQLKSIKSQLSDSEAVVSLVSGSGSTVFGVFSDREKAKKTRRGFDGENTALIVETVSRGDYRKSLSNGV
ncbi:MAG: 4-(cytidine 5'-diphospho)-2-C-methyl-D-erythritol kinase [Candidatus Aminicenantes bacterium]|nr:4-(cytidine 5'-diphospho)-2-C-methyl-D-erythritol kinase [Candidatus Aminicenantes bacterium]